MNHADTTAALLRRFAAAYAEIEAGDTVPAIALAAAVAALFRLAADQLANHREPLEALHALHDGFRHIAAAMHRIDTGDTIPVVLDVLLDEGHATHTGYDPDTGTPIYRLTDRGAAAFATATSGGTEVDHA
jgi:DNA-binding XRE family transcriptional regulator